MSVGVSYFSKNKITCNFCDYKFHVERCFTGRGRLNSLGIKNDLRIIYQPSKNFGQIYPLIYNIIVCPNCWFAALLEDFQFDKTKSVYDFKEIKKYEGIRKKQVLEIFSEIDFHKNRTLETGLASYYLAISCYQSYYKDSLKMAKKAILSLRASWVAEDLGKENLEAKELFNYIREYLRYLSYRKFKIYFNLMYSPKKSNFIEIGYHGPDLNYDYGYQGFVYVYSLLSYEFLNLIKSVEEQVLELDKVKIMLSRIFGFGKFSKKNPSPILEKSKIFYDIVKDKLKALEKSK